VSAIFVGNDVVDLLDPRTEGRSSDDRFVARVFDAEEQAVIRGATDPDLELWAHWAAKEAGFKVISKLIGAPPPFAHRTFEVRWTGDAAVAADTEEDVVRRGLVTHAGHTASVSVLHRPGSVHAIAFGPGTEASRDPALLPRLALLDAPHSRWAASLEDLRARFTPRELDAVYSRQSAAVRLGARGDLARALSVEEQRLEIVCDPGPTSQRPPRVLLDGRRAAADVSLSHDGRWIAWLLWIDNELEEG